MLNNANITAVQRDFGFLAKILGVFVSCSALAVLSKQSISVREADCWR